MADTASDQLRRLVRCYADGLLDRKTYRRLRRNLIEASERGEQGPPEDDDRSGSTAIRRRLPDEPGTRAIGSVRHGRHWSLPGNRRWAVLVLGLLIGATALALWTARTQTDSDRAGDSNPPAVASWQDAEAERARRILTDFVNSQDWNDESIRDFLSGWADIRPDVRRDLEATSWYQDAVREMLAKIDHGVMQGHQDGAAESEQLQALKHRFERERGQPAVDPAADD